MSNSMLLTLANGQTVEVFPVVYPIQSNEANEVTEPKARKAPAKPKGKIVCSDCGKKAKRTGWNQKRCADCRTAKEKANKEEYLASKEARNEQGLTPTQVANRELAARMRAVGLKPNGAAWTAAKAGADLTDEATVKVLASL